MTLEKIAQELADLRLVVLGTRLDREEVAKRLRKDPHTVTRWVRSGRFPAPKGGTWLLADIVEWERSKPLG